MKEGKRGLYIHIPYCASKCAYCDFVSYVGREDTMEAYLCAVVAEARKYAGATVDTVYIGGGTPSFLKTGCVSRLLEGVAKYIRIDWDAEVSLEANPNSLCPEKAREYKRTGVNRLSIGLQTIQDRLLKTIGRTHVYADFLRALDAALAAGIANINADLIYSLPGEQIRDALESAETLSRLPLTHVSAYALKLEKGVPLYGAALPGEAADRAMFYAVKQVLEDAGFARYEISNFAKKGYACAHNLKYWRVEEYIGLGAAAHSFYQGVRYANTKELDTYIAHAAQPDGAVCYREPAEPLFEKIMLKTRLCEGIGRMELPGTGKFDAALARMASFGLCRVGDRVTLTDKGMDLHDFFVTELLACL